MRSTISTSLYQARQDLNTGGESMIPSFAGQLKHKILICGHLHHTRTHLCVERRADPAAMRFKADLRLNFSSRLPVYEIGAVRLKVDHDAAHEFLVVVQ